MSEKNIEMENLFENRNSQETNLEQKNDNDLEKNISYEEEKKWTNKKFIKYLSFIIILLFILWLSWYAYYWLVVNNKTSANELNYQFKLEWNIENLNWEKVINNFDFKLNDWKILSINNWLHQKLSIWELMWHFKDSENNRDETKSIKNLDILSENENIYFFLENWFDEIKDLLAYTFSKKDKLDEINNSFKEWKYIKIDNSKALLELFWDLVNNELIKQILIWATTSNPKEYYKVNWVVEKLREYLKKDDILDYLFVEWEKNEITNKVSLSINENICIDFWPIMANYYKELWTFRWLEIDENYIIDSCKKSISNLNTMLPMFTQIYKQWDIENGNYKFELAWWELININIDYKNHLVDTWNISIKDPGTMIDVKMNWNWDWILSSNIKIKIEKDWIKIYWEIIDWNWEIKISWKDDNFWYEISWNINFEDYLISKIYIKWNIESIFGIWDLLIDLDSEKINANLNFADKNNKESIKINVDITKENKKISVNFFNKKTYTEGEINFDYDNWNLSWNYKYGKEEWFLEWDLISLADFYINIFDKEKKSTIDLSWKQDLLNSSIKYSLKVKIELIEMFEWNLEIKKSKENWFDVYDIWFNLKDKIWLSGAYLDWYSSDARNSKRRADLNSILSVISIKLVEWIPLSSIVIRDENYEWKDIIVWWKKLEAWKDYFVWHPNYTALWIKKEDFMDPNWSEYIIWVTTMKNWKYEIFSKMEGPNWDSAHLVWTYKPQKEIRLEKWKDYEESFNSININWAWVWILNKWDIVNWWVKVLSVSKDLQSITFDKEITWEEIIIPKDSDWLIFINNKVIKNYEILNKEKESTSSDKTIKWNIKFSIKKWLVDFEIPSEINQIETNINEMIILPDFKQNYSGDKKYTYTLWLWAWAVWWTVAYISLSWYSADARNSKRTSDLNNIMSSIMTKTTEWVSLAALVTRVEKYEWKDVIVWWKKLEAWIDYFVWYPNYTALWIKKEDFMDPDWSEYIIWVTTMKNWKYEIMAKIENSDWNIVAKLEWNYIPQKRMFLKKWKDYSIIEDNVIKITDNSYINKIFRGDIINWNQVIKISSDLMTITFKDKFDNSTIILSPDSKSLIYIDWENVEYWWILNNSN